MKGKSFFSRDFLNLVEDTFGLGVMDEPSSRRAIWPSGECLTQVWALMTMAKIVTMLGTSASGQASAARSSSALFGTYSCSPIFANDNTPALIVAKHKQCVRNMLDSIERTSTGSPANFTRMQNFHISIARYRTTTRLSSFTVQNGRSPMFGKRFDRRLRGRHFNNPYDHARRIAPVTPRPAMFTVARSHRQ